MRSYFLKSGYIKFLYFLPLLLSGCQSAPVPPVASLSCKSIPPNISANINQKFSYQVNNGVFYAESNDTQDSIKVTWSADFGASKKFVKGTPSMGAWYYLLSSETDEKFSGSRFHANGRATMICYLKLNK